MHELEKCSALVGNECKNGFYVNGPCSGIAGVPMCLKENLCGRLYSNTGGKPRPMNKEHSDAE